MAYGTVQFEETSITTTKFFSEDYPAVDKDNDSSLSMSIATTADSVSMFEGDTSTKGDVATARSYEIYIDTTSDTSAEVVTRLAKVTDDDTVTDNTNYDLVLLSSTAIVPGTTLVSAVTVTVKVLSTANVDIKFVVVGEV